MLFRDDEIAINRRRLRGTQKKRMARNIALKNNKKNNISV
jgi:hypothetical protein